MKSWIDYWNSDHPIYVNDRHKSLHAAAVGRDILRHVPSPDAVVLDHGCGEALYAETVAPGCGKLILCEAAPTVREKLAQRLASHSKVSVIGADGVAALPDGSLDLVVANSLLQYLSRDELAALLDLWRVKLKPGGRLVIADVIPPDVSPLTDATALLSFGWKGGFLVPAVAGLVKTALSDYRKIRSTLGFSTYREADFVGLLAQHGLKATRIHPNFGHNQARMTFSAQRTG
ncbi:methyltransferase domain-containing protein [Leptospira interrogans]